jgi:hypothetical protein
MRVPLEQQRQQRTSAHDDDRVGFDPLPRARVGLARGVGRVGRVGHGLAGSGHFLAPALKLILVLVLVLIDRGRERAEQRVESRDDDRELARTQAKIGHRGEQSQRIERDGVARPRGRCVR